MPQLWHRSPRMRDPFDDVFWTFCRELYQFFSALLDPLPTYSQYCVEVWIVCSLSSGVSGTVLLVMTAVRHYHSAVRRLVGRQQHSETWFRYSIRSASIFRPIIWGPRWIIGILWWLKDRESGWSRLAQKGATTPAHYCLAVGGQPPPGTPRQHQDPAETSCPLPEQLFHRHRADIMKHISVESSMCCPVFPVYHTCPPIFPDPGCLTLLVFAAVLPRLNPFADCCCWLPHFELSSTN